MQLFTQFPIETGDPQIQVMLPVGVHTLQLVVADAAGLKSDPVAVVVEVKKTAVQPPVGEPPRIDSLEPQALLWKSGESWHKQSAVIKGKNLDSVDKIVFHYEDMGGDHALTGDVTYALKPAGVEQIGDNKTGIKLTQYEPAAESLTLTLEVSEDAESADSGTISVTNAAGRSNGIDFFIDQAA